MRFIIMPFNYCKNIFIDLDQKVKSNYFIGNCKYLKRD